MVHVNHSIQIKYVVAINEMCPELTWGLKKNLILGYEKYKGSQSDK